MRKKFLRFLFMPIGLLRGLILLANSNARDFINKIRYPHSKIDNGCCISKDTVINTHTHILSNCTINHSEIGRYTYIGVNSTILNTKIGNYCSIANDLLCGLGNHPINHFSTSPLFYRLHNTFNLQIIDQDLDFPEYKPIHIGHDVWIGARVIILDGVTIGNGAIIAAGAVVTKDIPPYSIAAGIPARVIKYRENKQSNWWNLSPEAIWKNFKEKNI